MQPAWIIVIIVGLLAVGLAVGLTVVSLENGSPECTETPPLSAITIHTSILGNKFPETVDTVDERYQTLIEPDASEYEISAVTETRSSPEAPRKRYIFKKRDPTGWYATVHRFTMGFHSLYIKQKNASSEKSLIFGEEGLPSADAEPPYRYDSLEPGMIVPNVSSARQVFVGEMDLACTARFLDFEFEIYSNIHTIRVNISYQGIMGDILLWNEETGEFEYYDADSGMFTIERPSNTASLSPPNMHKQLKALAKQYAVPIPVSILNGISWDTVYEDSNIDIELIPDTSVMFRREAPRDYDREWIMKHVCFPSLTNAISAIINVY